MAAPGGHNVVQMDYQVVGDASKAFSTGAELLEVVGKILEVSVQVLRAEAFLSFGTSLALAQYLDNIRQKDQNLAKICRNDFATPLAQAITDHQNGDVQGKSYFTGNPA